VGQRSSDRLIPVAGTRGRVRPDLFCLLGCAVVRVEFSQHSVGGNDPASLISRDLSFSACGIGARAAGQALVVRRMGAAGAAWRNKNLPRQLVLLGAKPPDPRVGPSPKIPGAKSLELGPRIHSARAAAEAPIGRRAPRDDPLRSIPSSRIIAIISSGASIATWVR
jgi:hypothetical protein